MNARQLFAEPAESELCLYSALSRYVPGMPAGKIVRTLAKLQAALMVQDLSEEPKTSRETILLAAALEDTANTLSEIGGAPHVVSYNRALLANIAAQG